MVNVELVQWSNLLAAAMLLPVLGGIAAGKPNIGIAMVAHANRLRSLWAMVIGAAVLLAVSFAVFPGWLPFWLENARSAPHMSPMVLRPGGPLLLATLVKWRRPEARLVAALACVPMTPTFYDPVLLFLVTRTFREALLLTVCTFVLFFIVVFAGPIRTATQWERPRGDRVDLGRVPPVRDHGPAPPESGSRVQHRRMTSAEPNA